MNMTVKCPLSKSISHWDILLLSVLPGMQCMAAKNQPVHFSPSIRWPKYWMLGTLMPWLYVHVFVVRLLGHFIIILKCSNVVHKLVPLPLTNDFPNLVSYLPSSFDYYSAFLLKGNEIGRFSSTYGTTPEQFFWASSLSFGQYHKNCLKHFIFTQEQVNSCQS